jgi:hypothetical protein
MYEKPMIITDKFVFIHLPRAGGTFITDMLYHVFRYRRNENFMDLKYPLDAQYINARKVLTQHGLFSQIPEEYKHKTIISCMRNPFDRYVSLYECHHWVHFPYDTEENLRKSYAAYPDLDFKDYLILENNVGLRTRIYHENLHVDIGALTYQFILYFFKDPQSVISILSDDYIASERYKSDMAKILFLRTESLNHDLHSALLNLGYPEKEISFILTAQKINKSDRKKGDEWTHYYNDELLEYVRLKERFLFKLFPEYL